VKSVSHGGLIVKETSKGGQGTGFENRLKGRQNNKKMPGTGINADERR
jgi:hypothetical protein